MSANIIQELRNEFTDNKIREFVGQWFCCDEDRVSLHEGGIQYNMQPERIAGDYGWQTVSDETLTEILSEMRRNL
jgi:hypothetical protein